MKVISYKDLTISRLDLPGDIKTRMASERVIALASSFTSLGQIHDPVVRYPGYKLLVGGDRIAAHLLNKDITARCKVVECTDKEAEEMEIAENVYRRHDPGKRHEQLERILAIQTARAEPVVAEKKALNKRTRTARGVARVAVAAQRGVKVESVRKAEARAKVAKAPKGQFGLGNSTKNAPFSTSIAIAMREQVDRDALPPEGDPEPPPISAPWGDMESGWMGEVGEVKDALETAAKRIQVALAGLTNLRKSKLPVDGVRVALLWDALHGVSAMVRGMVPTGVCPWCKGTEGVQENCAACATLGYITAAVTEVPEELLDTENVVVALDGEYVALETGPVPAEGEWGF
jgi:hypothetical protein